MTMTTITTTCLGEERGGQNQTISTTPCLTPTCTLSPSHTSQWPLVGRYPPQPGLYSDPPPTPSPSSLMAQAIFEPNLFPFTPQQLTNLVHSTHTHNYLSTKMEQTECIETLAFKTQTPGNYAKVIIQHSKHGKSLKSVMYLCFTKVFDFYYLPFLCHFIFLLLVPQTFIMCFELQIASSVHDSFISL